MHLLRATFTVPWGTEHHRVEQSLPKYQRTWVERMEMEGWKLCSEIAWNPAPLLETGGRSRYAMNAYFDRRPKELTLEVDNPKVIEELVRKYGAKVN